MDFFEVITPDEGVRLVLKALRHFRLDCERVTVQDALGRVLSHDVMASDDIPGFDRSTVDGYAVISADTFGSSEAIPAFLSVIGEVYMGRHAEQTVGPGEAVRVSTGSMLPDSADAVVMIEHTEDIGGEMIGITKGVAPGENLVRRGQDLARGEPIMLKGKRLGPSDLAGLAGSGHETVEVFKRPCVAVLSTGDEIVPVYETPGPGQVRDMNSVGLGAMALQDGAEVIHLGLVKDDQRALKERITSTRDSWGTLLVSGGSSVGSRDVTLKVLSEIGPPGILAHGLALKPGKPTILGMSGSKPVFGLPGHPASALVAYAAVVRPVILALGGETNAKPWLPSVSAKMTRNIASPVGRVDIVRVKLFEGDDGLLASPVLGGSALISPFIRADGYVKVPLGKNGLVAGEEVGVFLGGP